MKIQVARNMTSCGLVTCRWSFIPPSKVQAKLSLFRMSKHIESALSVSTSALEGCELSHSKPFASSTRKDFRYPLSMRLGGGGRRTRASLNDREKEKNISCLSLELVYRSSSTLPIQCTELRNPDPYVRPCQ